MASAPPAPSEAPKERLPNNLKERFNTWPKLSNKKRVNNVSLYSQLSLKQHPQCIEVVSAIACSECGGAQIQKAL